MKGFINDFFLMLQFLSRIPINRSLKCEPGNFRRGALFLPVVGFIIGGIQWMIYFAVSRVMPTEITAIVLFLSAAILTGALHIDGLGDTCDGFYAFKGRDRIIEIMKDSRIGTFACIAIVGDILLKAAAYNFILQKGAAEIIIVSVVTGRFSIVFLSLIGKRAKESGSGNLFIGNMSRTVVFLSAFIALAINIVLSGYKFTLISTAAAMAATVLVSRCSESKIGGVTGDLLGANNEVIEILTLLIYTAL